MTLDLRQLRHVLAVGSHHSFTRAAESIGLTQPALSRSIQSLEEGIGAKLFDRDRAHVVPTAVGLRLIELARPLVAQARAAEAELQQMVGLAGGLLRIGAGPFAAELSVGTAMGRLARQHPGICVDLVTQDWPHLLQALLNGELEVVIAETEHVNDDERIQVEPLPQHEGRFFCRAGHPLLGRSQVTLSEVLSYPVVVGVLPRRVAADLSRREPSAGRGLLEGTGATQLRVESLPVARRILLESDAIGVAVPRQVEREVADGLLAALPLQLATLRTNYGILRLAGRTPSPACTAFLGFLREVEHELAAKAAQTS